MISFVWLLSDSNFVQAIQLMPIPGEASSPLEDHNFGSDIADAWQLATAVWRPPDFLLSHQKSLEWFRAGSYTPGLHRHPESGRRRPVHLQQGHLISSLKA